MSDGPAFTALGARPHPPREPEPDECCGSGCEPCVYDLYWEALERYEEALRRWEARERPLDKPR